MPNDIPVAQYTLSDFQKNLSRRPEYQNLLRQTDSDTMRVFCSVGMRFLGYTVEERRGEPVIMRFPVAARFDSGVFDDICATMNIELGKVQVSKALINMQFNRASNGTLSRAILDNRNHHDVADRIRRTPAQIASQTDHQRKLSEVRKAVAWVASASNTFSDLGFGGDRIFFPSMKVTKKFSDRFYKGAYARRLAEKQRQEALDDEEYCAATKLESIERMERAFLSATEKDLYTTSTSGFIKSQAGNIGGNMRWGGTDSVVGEFYGGLGIGGYLHRYTLALAHSMRPQARANPQHWYDIAAFLMIGIIRAHPYLDGNGRTARSLYAITLIKNNMPFIAPERDWQQNQIHNRNIDAFARPHPPANPNAAVPI